MKKGRATREQFLESMRYDKDQGKLFWKEIRGSRARPGQVVGTEAGSGGGRLQCSFNGKRYQVSHIIWLIETGNWPKGVIDHIDRNPANDRFSNLRDISQRQNVFHETMRNEDTHILKTDKGDFCVTYRQNEKSIVVGIYKDEKTANLILDAVELVTRKGELI